MFNMGDPVALYVADNTHDGKEKEKTQSESEYLHTKAPTPIRYAVGEVGASAVQLAMRNGREGIFGSCSGRESIVDGVGIIAVFITGRNEEGCLG